MKNVLIAVLVVVIAAMGYVIFQENNSSTSQLQTDQSQSTGESSATKKPSSGNTLDLANAGLKEVPKDKLDNGSITVFDVSGNNLTGSLPAEIRKLTKLEELDASDNNLTGIPAEIGQLSKLKKANFADNNISGLPLELGNLSNLETLDLRGNPNVSAYDISQIQSKIPQAKILTD